MTYNNSAKQDRDDDQRLGVGLPVLLLVGVDPEEAVQPALDGGDDGRQEDALVGEHAGHVGAEERRDRDDDREEDRDLEEALTHRLELLPAQQRVQEVAEHEHAHDQAEQIRALHTRSSSSMRPASDANTATSRRMAMTSMEPSWNRRRQVPVQTSDGHHQDFVKAPRGADDQATKR